MLPVKATGHLETTIQMSTSSICVLNPQERSTDKCETFISPQKKKKIFTKNMPHTFCFNSQVMVESCCSSVPSDFVKSLPLFIHPVSMLTQDCIFTALISALHYISTSHCISIVTNLNTVNEVDILSISIYKQQSCTCSLMITQLHYLILQSELKQASKNKFQTYNYHCKGKLCSEHSLLAFCIFPKLQATTHTENLPCLERLAEIKSELEYRLLTASPLCQ